MSINIKKKAKLYKVLDQPNLLDLLVFSFLIDEYHKLIQLNKTIEGIIVGKMEKYIDKIVNKFNKNYKEYLLMDKLTMKGLLRPYYSSKRQLKIDIPIYFSPKKCLKEETAYSLSYSYEITRKQKIKKYLWKTEFFLTHQFNRTLWMYKQEEQEPSDLPLYTTDTIPLNYGDKMCLLIPFYNFYQKIQAQKITFFPLQKINNTVLECPIQKLHEWVSYDYYKNPIDFEIEDLIRSYPDKLKTLSIKKSAINSNFKIQFWVKEQFQGKLFSYWLNCKKKSSPLTIDLKKKGYYDEKCKKIELRIDDILIIYIMKK